MAEESKASIIERVNKVIKETLRLEGEKIGQLTPNANFADDLGADSLDLNELRMGFEDEFDIEIADGDELKIKTPNEAVTYFVKRIADKALQAKA